MNIESCHSSENEGKSGVFFSLADKTDLPVKKNSDSFDQLPDFETVLIKQEKVTEDEESICSSSHPFIKQEKTDEYVDTQLLHPDIEYTYPPFQCDYPDSNFITKLEDNNNCTFTCDSSNTSVSFKSNLNPPTKEHVALKPHTCGICLKSFPYKSSLICHERTHSGEKPFRCEFCKNSFSRESSLVIHMRTHSGEKPYKCELCDKSFSIMSNLTYHTMTHSNDEPLTCKLCPMSFNLKHDCNLNKKIQSGKQFVCEICNKMFVRKRSLDDHKVTHSIENPFTCKVCNKAFTRKYDLVAHKVVHSEERAFMCEVCHKTFHRKRNLAFHKRITHPGDNSFTCDFCEKTFPRKDILVAHTRRHFGEVLST